MHVNSINQFNRLYKGNSVTYFQLGLNDKQISDLKLALMGFTISPGTYSLTGFNCTSVAILSLNYAGISIYDSHGGIYSAQYSNPLTLGIALNSNYNNHLVNGIKTFQVGR